MNDKLKHFLAAAGIAIAAIAASHLWFPMQYNWDMVFGFFIATLASAAKEVIYDKWLKMGTPDYYDFFWGLTGAVAGPVLWMIGELILGVAEPLPNFI